MYAVIETGGKQYRVESGAKVRVESLPAEVGAAVSFDEVLAWDTYYIENWSLWLDIKIMIKTMWVMFAARGN